MASAVPLALMPRPLMTIAMRGALLAGTGGAYAFMGMRPSLPIRGKGPSGTCSIKAGSATRFGPTDTGFETAGGTMGGGRMAGGVCVPGVVGVPGAVCDLGLTRPDPDRPTRAAPTGPPDAI